MDTIELIVGGFILNAANELLVISGDKWNEKFVVPGGHIEPGEDVESALAREVMEETGLEITIEKLLGIQESIGSAFAPSRHMVFLDYLCRCSSMKIESSEEAKRHHWLPRAEMETISLGEFTKSGIEKYAVCDSGFNF